MSKKLRFLSIGFLTLALLVGVGVGTVNAALTMGALTIASDGVLNLNGTSVYIGSGTTTNLTGNGDITALYDLSAIRDAYVGRHIISTTTGVPAVSGSCTGEALVSGGTDAKGTITTTSCTASQTLTVTFNTAYASAPSCVVSPANAAGALLTGAAAGTFASASATVLTITTPAAATTAGSWSYMCMQ